MFFKAVVAQGLFEKLATDAMGHKGSSMMHWPQNMIRTIYKAVAAQGLPDKLATDAVGHKGSSMLHKPQGHSAIETTETSKTRPCRPQQHKGDTAQSPQSMIS